MIAGLEQYVGQSISQICSFYGTAPHINNCAHFVSHALSYRIQGAALCSNVAGTTCDYKHRHEGFCIRVDQVFNSLSNRGNWPEKPPTGQKIAVAMLKSNFVDDANFLIGDQPKKHIGIFHQGLIYNFSNSNHIVKKSPVDHFKTLYGVGTILLIADLP